MYGGASKRTYWLLFSIQLGVIHIAMCIQKDGIKDGGLAGYTIKDDMFNLNLTNALLLPVYNVFKINLIANNILLKVSLATSFQFTIFGSVLELYKYTNYYFKYYEIFRI